MRPGRGYRQALAGALFAGPIENVAAIQVVGDAACGYYDGEIKAWARCVDGRVVTPDGAPATSPPPRRDARASQIGDVGDSASRLARAVASAQPAPVQGR